VTRRVARVTWLALALLLLAGCAAERPVPQNPKDAGQSLRTQLRALRAWRADGRLVVKADGQGTPASFTWTERPDDTFRLRLSGPWGQGAARLAGGPGQASLVTGDGTRYVARDAHALLAGAYGWDIPVSALRHWLLGLPGEEDAQFTLDRYGRLATLDWHGWHVEYRRYRQVNGLDLPAVLTAKARKRQAEVRVAIDNWHLDGRGEQPAATESPIPLMGN